jgi:tryptophan synthase alpha chain
MSAHNYSNDKPAIMAHLVAGYPDAAGAMAAARALASGGARYLEIQFPFSDPSADGPVIQTACVASLERGFSLDSGFAFVKEAAKLGLPIFIMSYASLVCARGVKRFCADAKASGAAGLIIPDLCWGEDEGLYAEGKRAGLDVVPVAAPGMSEARRKEIVGIGGEYVYAALRTGITGKKSEIGAENIAFVEALGSGGAKVLAGFGIRGRDQVTALAGHVHAAIVGSAFTAVIGEAAKDWSEAVHAAVLAKIRELVA